MKVHLTPSIINRYHDVTVQLIDLHFPELNLTLKEGVDVVVCTPYPNKTILVARGKKGRKALNGIIVDLTDDVSNFTMIARWSIDAERVVTHKVNFEIVDKEYDIATQDPVMWYATGDKTQEDRWPCEFKTPCNFNPRMKVLFNEIDSSKEGDFKDHYENSWLITRVENYKLPSIKSSHLYGRYNPHIDRMPNIADAFLVKFK